MKGIIFTEFMAFVAEERGENLVDDLLAAAGLEDTAFTSVGTYDFAHLAKLVGHYCQATSSTFSEALRAFGMHLGRVFQRKFGGFYSDHRGILEMLCHVDDQIHLEVRKLYPDAELPTFKVIDKGNSHIVIDYFSCRPLADLALGLMEESARYYGERLSIERHEVNADGLNGCRFEIKIVTASNIDRAA